ncbi:MAG: hypothetical protein QM676_14595 [Novosphingobium sp.]
MNHEIPPDAELLNDDIVHALGHSWFFDPHTIDMAISEGKGSPLRLSVRSARERRAGHGRMRV